MIVTLIAFSEVLKELEARRISGYDGVMYHRELVIQGKDDLSFLTGVEKKLKFLDNNSLTGQIILEKNRDLVETMTSIKKGRIDLRGFWEMRHKEGPAINVGAVNSQRRLIKDLEKSMATYNSNQYYAWSKEEKGDAGHHIKDGLLELMAYPGGQDIAKRLWDFHLSPLPQPNWLFLSDELNRLNTLLTHDRFPERIIVNRRNLMFMHPAYRRSQQ